MHPNQGSTHPVPLDPGPLLRAHAELCKALGNQHRLAILCTLNEGELCVGDLAARLGISVHNVSQHLRVLREHRVVRPRKEGQTVYYAITNPKFTAACVLLRQAIIEEHQTETESLSAAAFLDEGEPGVAGGGEEVTGSGP
jgi:DNA-binding transcriptional ArsR family regulator